MADKLKKKNVPRKIRNSPSSIFFSINSGISSIGESVYASTIFSMEVKLNNL